MSTGTRLPDVQSAGPSSPFMLDLGSALPGYALPALTDSQWAAFSRASLPATVQRMLWPSQQVTVGATSPCITLSPALDLDSLTVDLGNAVVYLLCCVYSCAPGR